MTGKFVQWHHANMKRLDRQYGGWKSQSRAEKSQRVIGCGVCGCANHRTQCGIMGGFHVALWEVAMWLYGIGQNFVIVINWPRSNKIRDLTFNNQPPYHSTNFGANCNYSKNLSLSLSGWCVGGRRKRMWPQPQVLQYPHDHGDGERLGSGSHNSRFHLTPHDCWKGH